jgi:hypothetical protein
MRKVLISNRQLFGERSLLDQQSYMKLSSSEAVQSSRRLLVLKQKQIALEDGVFSNIRKRLHELLQTEDKCNLETCGFPTDDPDFTVTDLPKLKAVLIDKFSPSTHYNLEEFLRVLNAQPWLEEHAITDIRYYQLYMI